MLPRAVLLLLFQCLVTAVYANTGLYGDFDHDGKPDAQASGRVDYGKRLIVLNNLDDDDEDNSPDNSDKRINEAGDRSDLVEFRLVAKSSANVIQLRLSYASSNPPVQIFNSDGKAVLGTGSARHTLSASETAAAKAAGQKFLVEGLAFASNTRLTVLEDGVAAYGATIEVAPFVLLPHTQPAIDNMVVEVPGWDASARYVQAFRRSVTAANVKPVVVKSDDVWMQDELEWGVTMAPHKTLHVALHMRRNRELADQVRALLAPDIGYYDYFSQLSEYVSGSVVSAGLDNGGNLEVTPPVPGHPYGRVYFGARPSKDTQWNCYGRRRIHPEYSEFFDRQGLQKPIEFTTDWLGVGHIDEVVTFVPAKERPKGFVMLVASPKLALDLLNKNLQEASPLPKQYRDTYGKATYGELMNWRVSGRSFENLNMFVDSKIFGWSHKNPAKESLVGTFMQELGLESGDIIEVPVLFFNEQVDNLCGPEAWHTSVGAVTPGLVNLSSMGDVSLIPDPFLAPFKSYVVKELSRIGQRVAWIDDWEVYHTRQGEVHCGSNARRQPFAKKWWQP